MCVCVCVCACVRDCVRVCVVCVCVCVLADRRKVRHQHPPADTDIMACRKTDQLCIATPLWWMMRQGDNGLVIDTDCQTVQVQCCFTSTEAIKTIREGEPRTATSTFTKLLSSESD